MEILPDFIHLCNNLWVLENDAFGGCVLQGLIHQRQNGLLITQGHPQTDQTLCFRALTSDAEAIAAAAANWILGIKSIFARAAPVTVDALYIHLTGALSRLIAAGAFSGLRITSGCICSRKEAFTHNAVRVVPVTSVALRASHTREFGMTVALACVYVAL